MFQLQSSASLTSLGMSRRAYLQAGLLGLGGLSLSDLLRLQAQAGSTPKKKDNPAVILLFAHGGPSHLETYDMKPGAPTEIRGPYRPIPTNVPGIEVCEHLPLHAKIADKFTLIRSCCHDEADHFAGHRRFLSGYGKLKPGFGYESNSPMVGAVVTRMLEGKSNGLPPALSINGVVVNGPDYAAGISEGYWPGMYGSKTATRCSSSSINSGEMSTCSAPCKRPTPSSNKPSIFSPLARSKPRLM